MHNGVKKQISDGSEESSSNESESLKSDYFRDLSAHELFYCLKNKSNGDFDDCLWRNMKIKDFDDIFGLMQGYSQLFCGGMILDIGCGDGQFSLLLSLKFRPQKLIGIDISKNCLMKASELKNRVLETEFGNRTSEESEIIRFISKCPSNLIQNNKIKHFDPIFRNSFIRDFRRYVDNKLTKEETANLKKNILFKLQNIFNYTESYKFSTIMCLSVVKWIGLNFGMTGIRKLFDKVKSLLEYKGVLVIDEPSKTSIHKTLSKNKHLKSKNLESDLRNVVSLLIEEYCFIVIKEKILPNKGNKKIYLLLSL